MRIGPVAAAVFPQRDVTTSGHQ